MEIRARCGSDSTDRAASSASSSFSSAAEPRQSGKAASTKRSNSCPLLVHGREGAYRPALVELLQLIYQGRDDANSLEQLAGQSFAKLDQQYLAFLRNLPQ